MSGWLANLPKNMRLILDMNEGNLVSQVRVATNAMKNGIKPGELWGFRSDNGTVYSVKRNKNSITVRGNK